MKPFEPFEPRRSSGTGRGVPTLRILSGGRLVLNAAAARMLGDITFVRLLWDDDTKRIGIEPSTAGDASAFRVTPAPSQAVITSKEFVETYQLPHSQRMRLGWTGTMWVASTIDADMPTGQE